MTYLTDQYKEDSVSKLACLGGSPVVDRLSATGTLASRADLERKYLLEAYDSGMWDDWPEAPESQAGLFSREWAEFNGSKYCALLTNGTHTLQVALETLDIGAGDEVIVPGFTWQATASAVCDVNAVPILVDVDPETMCVDVSQVEAAITPRTRAIMPVHLYHRMADMDRILAIARAHDLYVVEDAAHSHGSQWDGRGSGTLGDMGSYSFQRSKLMPAGEGGCLLMQDEELYWKVVSQVRCGREYNGVKVHSGDYRMTSFQAGILRGQLAAHRENAPRIDRNGRALDRAVADAPGTRPLRRSPHITRQCSYCYAFLYDPAAYDGLSGEAFRHALSAEVGHGFGGGYTPLSHSELYNPQTKKRHQLSAEYVRAITPSRWDLPVADELWRDRAMVTSHAILACAPEQAHLLTEAIAKVYENRDELLAQEPSA
jgi:L-glutamine:2-deoxy-scyllo-inosose/3-amino-2,3-dideoxy-scyllo-inosose aminotransferase